MSTLAAQRRLIIALQSAHAGQVIETHISWVLLIGGYAYKIKKAVDLGFLDYLTISSRKHFCEEELRLNRRTAPELYLEVVGIGGSADAPQFGVQPTIEYAVKMRRFPGDALMDACLRQGRVEPAHIDALASAVAHFHERAAVADAQATYGNAVTIRIAAMQNFRQMRTLLKGAADLRQVATLEKATMREWKSRAKLFAERRRQGRVRECHGDLHLGNIALIDDVPVPFDCIEFSPALRWIDVMDEVSFTMMDLLHHGRSDSAWRYLNAYLEASGDYAGVGVLRFYLGYRAAVRAKVAAIRASQSDDGARLLQSCRAHLALAQQCLSDSRPALIITHGLPGSGKTTFAQYALEQLGAVRIRSDVERKRLHGLAALDNSRQHTGDIYSAGATGRTYAQLLASAHTMLNSGYTVIVDAAFLRRDEREVFRALAEKLSLPFAIAALEAPDATLRQRLRTRRNDASEADESVLRKLAACAQSLDADELCYAAQFSTERAPDDDANMRNWKRLLGLTTRNIARCI